MAEVEDKDWREHKKFVLDKLESLDDKVDALSTVVQNGLAELRTEIAVMKAGIATVTREELEEVVAKAASSKKNSKTLTRDEIRDIAEESIKAKNGSKDKKVEPWKYVILGAAIVVAGGNLPGTIEFLLKLFG